MSGSCPVAPSILLSFLLPLLLRLYPLLLYADARRLRAIVLNQFREPRVLQRFASSDAAFRIVDENLAEEIEEELVEAAGRGDNIFEPFHRPHEFSRLARGLGTRVDELVVFEKARGRGLVVAAADFADFLYQMLVDLLSNNGLKE